MGVFNYLKNDIWKEDLDHRPSLIGWGIRILRALLFIWQGLTRRQIQQGAAFLTYYSLLAIVPIMAFLLTLSKALWIQDSFLEWLITLFAGQRAIVQELVLFAQQALNEAHKGGLAFISVLIAVWASIKVLIYAELAMNTIWGVRQERSLSKRFSDYLAMVCFLPLAILFLSLVTLVLSSTPSDVGHPTTWMAIIHPLRFVILNFALLIGSWLLLSFFYTFIPNTYVHFLPALVAGILTGSMYQGVQWLYLYCQGMISQYNAIYGTFAALPLFLIWVHLSWVIVLIGARMSFAFQNVSAYGLLSDGSKKISHRTFLILSLRIVHFCVKAFCHQDPPLSIRTLSRELKLSLSITNDIITKLIEAKLLAVVVNNKKGEEHYIPALPVEHLTVQKVIEMIEDSGEKLPIPLDREVSMLIDAMDKQTAIPILHAARLKDV